MSKHYDSQATLNISEGYDFPTQKHYVKEKCSCCDCFHKRCTFRVWQIVVFLLAITFIIGVLCVLIAMFGPGNTNLQYSEKEANVGIPTRENGDEEHTTTKTPIESTTEKTTKGTTGKPTATAKPTSVPAGHGTSLHCGVAIVGGGTAGLLMAYLILEGGKEKDVCVFEKENRLGGKIFDHRFRDAPNVTVGLGEWQRYGENFDLSDLIYHFNIARVNWGLKNFLHRVESRGVYTKSFNSLKGKAFPTLLHRPPTNNTNLHETAELVDGKMANNFSTAGTFLSSFLSPEGAKWMTDAYGFKGGYMEAINPESYKQYLQKKLLIEKNPDDNDRPIKGMSELIEKLALEVRNRNGTIYLPEAVTSVSKQGNKFFLVTRNFTVQANKTVLATGPEALKKMTGDVIENITNHEIFKSIVSVPAFHGAAVYPTAWWNDSDAAQKNNSLQPLQMFVSSSNCLGITMPYKFVSANETAVLHTIANNGGCSDKWGNILKVGKDAVDREMKRALEYKFQRLIPEPLDTVYKYWKEGFWYLQKPGTNFPLPIIRKWAKKPLAGNDVFLVGRAFYSFGGMLEDDILSTAEALKEGWDIDLPWA